MIDFNYMNFLIGEMEGVLYSAMGEAFECIDFTRSDDSAKFIFKYSTSKDESDEKIKELAWLKL